MSDIALNCCATHYVPIIYDAKTDTILCPVQGCRDWRWPVGHPNYNKNAVYSNYDRAMQLVAE